MSTRSGYNRRRRNTISTFRAARCSRSIRSGPATSSTPLASSVRKACSISIAVNTWIPYEVHTSPHDLPDYDEPLFPVADTPIGRLGCAICYDWLFPEAMRQLAANGAEVLIRVSAYGSVGRNRADGVVDGGESLSRTGEHCLRGSRKPGRESQALSALLVARWKSGSRFRRADAGGSITWARRADRGRAG